MTGDKFVVTCAPEKNYLEVTLSGFFAAEDLPAFTDALQSARSKLGSDTASRRTLYDVSSFRLQAPETVAHFGALMADPKTRSGRLAIYTGDAAVRMQVNRIANEMTKVFDDIDEARQWLWQDS